MLCIFVRHQIYSITKGFFKKRVEPEIFCSVFFRHVSRGNGCDSK